LFVLKNFTDHPQATPYYGIDYDNITYSLGMWTILHYKFCINQNKITFSSGQKNNVNKISIELLGIISLSMDREEVDSFKGLIIVI